MIGKNSIIERYENNPILTKDDIPYPVETVHNAAATLFNDRIILLFRSHLRNGRSIIGIAQSDDGLKFKVSNKPFLVPAEKNKSSYIDDFALYEEYGVEDPRITRIDEYYYITYSAYSRFGVRIGLARTKDFREVERVAFISQSDMRNVVIFPEKIDGKYYRLDRPHTEIMPWSIWLSSSTDLVHWGNSRIVIMPLKYHWDEMKVGPGTPPIKTNEGWLHIFHGVFKTMDGAVYRLGVALHNLKDPSVVVGVSDEWILQPEELYERVGYVHNVVFSCGMVKTGVDDLIIYWGGADSVLCAGKTKISHLVSLCKSKNRPGIV